MSPTVHQDCKGPQAKPGDSLAAPAAAVHGVRFSLPESPMAGIFRFPCGIWVSPVRFASGATWWRPLAIPTGRVFQITKQRSA